MPINHSCSIECQVQGALKSVKLVGNINEVGAKKLDICTQSNGDGKQAQTLECSADGKWEIADRKWEFTDGNWETGSTLYILKDFENAPLG